MKFLLLLLNFLLIYLCSCNHIENLIAKNNNSMPDSTMKNDTLLKPENFQDSIDNKKCGLFVLKNKKGMSVSITNYGGRIVGLTVPDKNGKPTDVVVGFNSVKKYIQSTEPYFGATIGRYGNRIAKGKFSLDGTSYSLFKNNGPNTLHGGKNGFQSVVWNVDQAEDNSLELSYLSKDGEENFPGNLKVKVKFSVTENNELIINYYAETDKNTVINLTNHAFFNLNGEGSGTILKHSLQIFADSYTPVDSTLIPTGKIENVKNTPFDFSVAKTIGSRIDTKNDQLKFGKGYDHNYVLNKKDTASMHHAAKVIGDISGIEMNVFTREPGLQFYSGNFMQSKNTFKSGSKDDFRTAFCLETQHFPDSPNQPQFPSTELMKNKPYHSETIYKFN